MATTVVGIVYGLNGGTATVDFGGGNTVATDAGGEFEISLPNGTYTASCTSSLGATVLPASLQVVVNNQDELFVAGGFWIAPIVQAINASFSGSSTDFSFPNPITEGNSIIVVAQSVSTSASVDYGVVPAVSVSDTQGLIYNKVAPSNYGPNGDGASKQAVQDCFLATGAASGSNTIQVTLGTDIASSIIYILEVPPTLPFCSYGTYVNYASEYISNAQVNTNDSVSLGLSLAAFNATVTEEDEYAVAVSGGWQPIADGFLTRGISVSSQLQDSIIFTNAAGGSSNMIAPAVATLWVFCPKYAISGTISGPGGSGAIVYADGPNGLTYTTADGSGNYSFPNLFNGDYTVWVNSYETPFSFSPSYLYPAMIGANVTGQNFSSSENTYVVPPRFAFVERASTTPGATVYDVMDGASINSLGRTTGYGTGKKVGELFWDNVVNQAWSFNLQDNQPYIAAGSADAQDISTFAAALAAPAGVTPVQPGPTPSTRFAFTAIQTRSGQAVLKYLVSDGPSAAYGSMAQIVWDGVFDRWTFLQTNAESEISSPADVANITQFVASLPLINPNQISL
jgi:hypothetical protein